MVGRFRFGQMLGNSNASAAYADYKIIAMFSVRGISGDSLEAIEEAIKEEIKQTIGEIDGLPLYDTDIKVYFRDVIDVRGEIVSGSAIGIVEKEIFNRSPRYMR